MRISWHDRLTFSVGVLLVYGLSAGSGGCAARVEPRIIAPRVIENKPLRVVVTSYPGEPEAIDVISASAIGPGWGKPVWGGSCFVRPTTAEGRPGQRIQVGRPLEKGFRPLSPASIAGLLPGSNHRLVLRVRYAGRLWRILVPVEIERRNRTLRYRLLSERLRDLGPEP